MFCGIVLHGKNFHGKAKVGWRWFSNYIGNEKILVNQVVPKKLIPPWKILESNTAKNVKHFPWKSDIKSTPFGV